MSILSTLYKCFMLSIVSGKKTKKTSVFGNHILGQHKISIWWKGWNETIQCKVFIVIYLDKDKYIFHTHIEYYFSVWTWFFIICCVPTDQWSIKLHKIYIIVACNPPTNCSPVVRNERMAIECVAVLFSCTVK